MSIVILITTIMSSWKGAALDGYTHDVGSAKFEIEFSDADSISRVSTDSANTSLSFDSAEIAMKVKPAADGNAPARFIVGFDSGIAAGEYPVIAVLVKTAGTLDPTFSTRTSGTNAAKSAGAYLGNSSSAKVNTWGLINTPSECAASDGYVLLTADLWQATEIYGKSGDTVYPLVYDKTLISTIIDLLPYSDAKWTYNDTDCFYVKSVAVFDSIKSAELYYGLQVDSYRVLKLDSQENVDRYSSVVQNSTAASFSYDEGYHALSVKPDTSKADGATVKIEAESLAIDPMQYPYIAVKVKLKDTSSVFGQVAGYTAASQVYKNRVGGSTYNIAMKGNYEAVSDWQLLCLNTGEASLQSSSADPLQGYPLTSHTVWKQILIQLSPYNVADTDDEEYLIEWIGFFGSHADAEEYYRLSGISEGYEASDAVGYYGCQERNITEGKYDVRFISTVNSLDFESAGMIITAECDSGYYDLSFETTLVYESLNALDGNGNTVAVTASEIGGQYIMAITVGNIPYSAGDVTFKVTPYCVKNGVKYTSETFTVCYDAGGTLTSQCGG